MEIVPLANSACPGAHAFACPIVLGKCVVRTVAVDNAADAHGAMAASTMSVLMVRVNRNATGRSAALMGAAEIVGRALTRVTVTKVIATTARRRVFVTQWRAHRMTIRARLRNSPIPDNVCPS